MKQGMQTAETTRSQMDNTGVSDLCHKTKNKLDRGDRTLACKHCKTKTAYEIYSEQHGHYFHFTHYQPGPD